MIKLHVVVDTHLCFLSIKHFCLRKMKNDIGCNVATVGKIGTLRNQDGKSTGDVK